jgi:hypothetical protein
MSLALIFLLVFGLIGSVLGAHYFHRLQKKGDRRNQLKSSLISQIKSLDTAIDFLFKIQASDGLIDHLTHHQKSLIEKAAQHGFNFEAPDHLIRRKKTEFPHIPKNDQGIKQLRKHINLTLKLIGGLETSNNKLREWQNEIFFKQVQFEIACQFNLAEKAIKEKNKSVAHYRLRLIKKRIDSTKGLPKNFKEEQLARSNQMTAQLFH